MYRYGTGMVVLVLVLAACRPDDPIPVLTFPALMEVPEGFPEVPFPAENEFTELRWELGKKLFYDIAMSVDSSVSCASCHRPDLAFSDDQAFSPGANRQAGTRNSPTLANIAYHPYYTREGGVPTLEMQILVPIQEHNEFDFNILLIAERLKTDATYVEMALAAYDREPDAYVITRALACFERSLLSGESTFDRHQRGIETLPPDGLRGLELFFSERTQCSTCHSGFNFTNYAFANNGLYETYTDTGRHRLTGEETDRAMFKIPTLRNIDLTAPYMHDGSLTSLEAVVEHYNRGGHGHPNQDESIRPLALSEREQADLVAFLESLTDYAFAGNPLFR